jgi:uncharacterized damage-inducible protein DinB
MINQLNHSINKLLKQLEKMVSELSDQQFSTPVALLGQSTIGQHMRHILEFYIELGNGYHTGLIDYDGRKRNHDLQTIRSLAIAKIEEIRGIINFDNKDLQILTICDFEDQERQQLPTNYFRELMYNLEHTVHHMALIRVAVCLITEISLPEDFGVAASTIKHRKACAQ